MPMKKWNGSAWVDMAVKYWNGSAWIDAASSIKWKTGTTGSLPITGTTDPANQRVTVTGLGFQPATIVIYLGNMDGASAPTGFYVAAAVTASNQSNAFSYANASGTFSSTEGFTANSDGFTWNLPWQQYRNTYRWVCYSV